MGSLPARLIVSALALLPGPSLLRAADGSPEGSEFFEKKIRPVLVQTCQKCHDGHKHKGNLQLTSRANILKGGDSGPAIVPGQPDKSLLVKALRYTDDMLRMPPKSKLPDDQIADFTIWIKMGVPWPDAANLRSGGGASAAFDLQARKKHWCWQPLQGHKPPAVKQIGWLRSPIDNFVLAKLEANGLSPAEPAERRTLIRRVTYDLIGLPPTPGEIDAFLADDSPNAFAKVVERLLESPHYGERWGRHWLDLVRYAETYGHEYDFEIPEASAYRDYVIRAFNADVPYDQLVLEHVAGDLLPRPRCHPRDGFNESILGTGFWFLGEAAHSPVDVRADEADHIDNQIDVFAKTFLGLTVSCARCHDHKFDAITTKDYYALSGYLQSSRLQRAFIDSPERDLVAICRMKELVQAGMEIAIPVTAGTLHERVAKFEKYLLASRAAAVKPTDLPGLDNWLKASHKLDLAGRDALLQPWAELAVPRANPAPQEFTVRRDKLTHRLKAQIERAAEPASRYTVLEDFKKGSYQDWYVTGEAFGTGPSRVSDVVLQPKGTPVKAIVGPGMAHSGLVSSKLRGVMRSRSFVIAKKKILYHVAGHNAQINLIIDGYQLIRDPIYGGLTIKTRSDPLGIEASPWSILGTSPQWGWRVQDVSMWLGHRAYIELIDDGPGFIALDQILFSDDGPPANPPNSLLLKMLDDPGVASPESLARKYQELFLEIVAQWQSDRLEHTPDCKDRIAILNWLLQSPLIASLDAAPPLDGNGVRKKLLDLWESHKQIETSLAFPRRALAMADGTAWNDRVHIRGNPNRFGEEVPRRFLEAIAGSNQPCAKVGSSRLELASRIIDSSNPLLPRVMVNRIWQHHFGAGLVRSPDNFGALGELPTHPQLLDYLAAEFVRHGWSIKHMHRMLLLSSDYQMASLSDDASEAGDPQNKLLHRMPIQRLEAECIRDAVLAVSGRLDGKMYGRSVPPYLTPHMAGRGRPPNSGPLDGDGRRSIYLGVRRNFLTPMFLAFDYPIPFTTMGRRSVSNVPAQALALMNNPFVVQQAETWANKVLSEKINDHRQRIIELYVTAFGRPPDDRELAEAQDFLHDQAWRYNRSDDPLAWRDLCHVLLNVKEFIFIN